MGDHYDSCYEADNKAKAEKEDKGLREEIELFAKTASNRDKKFICKIIRNIESYTGFFKVLRQEK